MCVNIYTVAFLIQLLGGGGKEYNYTWSYVGSNMPDVSTDNSDFTYITAYTYANY